MSAALMENNIAMRSLTASKSQPAISSNSELDQTDSVARANVVDQEDVPSNGGYLCFLDQCPYLRSHNVFLSKFL